MRLRSGLASTAAHQRGPRVTPEGEHGRERKCRGGGTQPRRHGHRQRCIPGLPRRAPPARQPHGSHAGSLAARSPVGPPASPPSAPGTLACGPTLPTAHTHPALACRCAGPHSLGERRGRPCSSRRSVRLVCVLQVVCLHAARRGPAARAGPCSLHGCCSSCMPTQPAHLVDRAGPCSLHVLQLTDPCSSHTCLPRAASSQGAPQPPSQPAPGSMQMPAAPARTAAQRAAASSPGSPAVKAPMSHVAGLLEQAG
ncbi:uncharacterized protein ACIBXB_019016 [Morphnus guianensis]